MISLFIIQSSCNITLDGVGHMELTVEAFSKRTLQTNGEDMRIMFHLIKDASVKILNTADGTYVNDLNYTNGVAGAQIPNGKYQVIITGPPTGVGQVNFGYFTGTNCDSVFIYSALVYDFEIGKRPTANMTIYPNSTICLFSAAYNLVQELTISAQTQEHYHIEYSNTKGKTSYEIDDDPVSISTHGTFVVSVTAEHPVHPDAVIVHTHSNYAAAAYNHGYVMNKGYATINFNTFSNPALNTTSNDNPNNTKTYIIIGVVSCIVCIAVIGLFLFYKFKAAPESNQVPATPSPSTDNVSTHHAQLDHSPVVVLHPVEQTPVGQVDMRDDVNIEAIYQHSASPLEISETSSGINPYNHGSDHYVISV